MTTVTALQNESIAINVKYKGENTDSVEANASLNITINYTISETYEVEKKTEV